jgi:pSer/pThr/pTyr-binding forkhead associated (FHA) protein
MNFDYRQIQLNWIDPTTGEQRQVSMTPPITIGRDLSTMPSTIHGDRVSRLVLDSPQVSRFHALILCEQGQLVVTDQNSQNGTCVNGTRVNRGVLRHRDQLQVGAYTIALAFTRHSPADSVIAFHPDTDLPESRVQSRTTVATSDFPPEAFRSQQVSVQKLYESNVPVYQIDYAAIGAGLGSFIWVDFLRIFGVQVRQIIAIGLEKQPYARYQRLCLNSQIPSYERLRSNSDSCPDNIWGWPSYALREAWHDFYKGKISSALQSLWQVFAEPTFAETYTPRAGHVFDSIDREAKRIGWEQIFRYGRVRAIRKTDDGRYAISYSRSRTDRRAYAIVLAHYVHLATGYPAIQFLPDLQKYREQTQDFKSVVNAYEEHEHVYKHLERFGGTVLIRGRGIVASRIVQRIYEVRQHNRNIFVMHLMRSPKSQGNKFGAAQRQVENHYEFQPFNWPKACWGGELRAILESASPQQRQHLLKDWGGTTTAARSDWQRIVQEGISQGWYQITFGEVERVEREQQNTITYIKGKDLQGQIKLQADFIIDATGLEAKAKSSPLLDDLVTHYNLPLNHLGRLAVANDFEIKEMRSGKGRMYAAGAITLGGSYAAVDSFLGLQYAALRSADSLAAVRAPRMHRLNCLSSLNQWCKWVTNQSPA